MHSAFLSFLSDVFLYVCVPMLAWLLVVLMVRARLGPQRWREIADLAGFPHAGAKYTVSLSAIKERLETMKSNRDLSPMEIFFLFSEIVPIAVFFILLFLFNH